MSNTAKVPLIAAVAILITGCINKSDYDAHVANYEGLRDALAQWSGEVQTWQTRTKNVICDIVATTSADYTYAPETVSYCPHDGTEGNGVPPDPPEFGSF
jgi:hypothetical protein